MKKALALLALAAALLIGCSHGGPAVSPVSSSLLDCFGFVGQTITPADSKASCISVGIAYKVSTTECSNGEWFDLFGPYVGGVVGQAAVKVSLADEGLDWSTCQLDPTNKPSSTPTQSTEPTGITIDLLAAKLPGCTDTLQSTNNKYAKSGADCTLTNGDLVELDAYSRETDETKYLTVVKPFGFPIKKGALWTAIDESANPGDLTPLRTLR